MGEVSEKDSSSHRIESDRSLNLNFINQSYVAIVSQISINEIIEKYPK